MFGRNYWGTFFHRNHRELRIPTARRRDGEAAAAPICYSLTLQHIHEPQFPLTVIQAVSKLQFFLPKATETAVIKKLCAGKACRKCWLLLQCWPTRPEFPPRHLRDKRRLCDGGEARFLPPSPIKCSCNSTRNTVESLTKFLWIICCVLWISDL